MAVQVDYQRAEHLFGTLLKALTEKQYPYDIARVPQRPENWPDGTHDDPIKLGLFLFTCCYYMRGGIESDTAFLALKHIHERYPQLFDPNNFVQTGQMEFEDHTAERIAQILKDHKLGYSAKQTSRLWVFNATKLGLHWEANPLKLFEDIENYEMLCNRIMHAGIKTQHVQHPYGFTGFREKMVSMLAYFFMDCKLVPPEAFPVPVDFHVMRMLTAHEVVRNDAVPLGGNLLTPEFQATARQLTRDYCVANGLNIVIVADILWLYSRAMCYESPGNIMALKKRDGRKSILLPPTINWTKNQLEKHWRTCGRCIVKNTCRICIPSGPYYVKGQLIKLAVREDPPDLFGGILIP